MGELTSVQTNIFIINKKGHIVAVLLLNQVHICDLIGVYYILIPRYEINSSLFHTAILLMS
jgi:hypothetical protein